MPKPITPQKMKQIDEEAIEIYGIPSLILMENAGRGVAEVVYSYAMPAAPNKRRGSVFIFCGTGNNGGDGMVCARYLFNKRLKVKVFLISGNSTLKGDPQINMRILKSMCIEISELKERSDINKIMRGEKANIIVDAIFGIGFRGEAQGIYRKVIDWINSTDAYKFCIDTPSGLDASTGRVTAVCVKADETLTMAFSKTGFYKNDGPRYTGNIKIIDIGLPKQIRI